jgi:heme-degrading monooxygenase HmoA
VPADKAGELVPYLKELRVLAMNQEGYIGGETLRSFEDPEKYMVISTWQSIEDWKNWFANPSRNEIQDKIDQLLGQKTEYEIYQYR